MANLKDIKRRIESVRKTQQITRAMRMVAGAKLRRAQEAIEAARPYAQRMHATMAAVTRANREVEHPLLERREQVRARELVIVSSDRGLCGAFNGNIVKEAARAVAERGSSTPLTITTAGKKVQDFVKRHHPDLQGAHYPQQGWVPYGQAVDIASRLAARYTEGEVDEIILVFSEFVSPMTQTPQAVVLLPFVADGDGDADGDAEPLPYEIEPDPEQLISVLAPRALEVNIYRALLENQAGEHGARMTAMENATRNTEELIESLTLRYNRARQAAITTELVEIVSGAEAL